MWTPPQSELRRQVGKILEKLHPLENGYSSIVDDMLRKYLHYINSKQRIAKINRIVSCVSKSIAQQAKTELLIEREIEDKKLNSKFYCSAQEPIEFVCVMQSTCSKVLRNLLTRLLADRIRRTATRSNY